LAIQFDLTRLQVELSCILLYLLFFGCFFF
jgi:hypothetical protein